MYIDLVTINLCPQGGGGVKPSGTLEISENGEYDVYSYSLASVYVHPSESLSETYISNGSYNITGEFNGGVITVDVPSGWDQKSVTEGTIEIINIDNTASFVASSAFEGNTNLQTVNLPYATTVGDNAFERCTSLTQVSLPMCSSIDYGAFYNCSSLNQVSLPMCAFLGENAFYNCTSLTQMSLPMCSHIGRSAFYRCRLLSIITIGYSSVCSLGGIGAFDGAQITSSMGSIYVPASLVDLYKSATNWSYFSTQIFPIE